MLCIKLPRLTYERAMRSAVGGRSRLPSFDALCLEWAGKLAKHIRLDQYRRRRMERTLTAAGMDMAPEVYEAYTLVKPGVILLCALICLAFLPLLSPLLVVLAVLIYFKEIRRADELTADMRSGSYEAALTRFEGRVGSPSLSDIARVCWVCCRATTVGCTFKCSATTLAPFMISRMESVSLF